MHFLCLSHPSLFFCISTNNFFHMWIGKRNCKQEVWNSSTKTQVSLSLSYLAMSLCVYYKLNFIHNLVYLFSGFFFFFWFVCCHVFLFWSLHIGFFVPEFFGVQTVTFVCFWPSRCLDNIFIFCNFFFITCRRNL